MTQLKVGDEVIVTGPLMLSGEPAYNDASQDNFTALFIGEVGVISDEVFGVKLDHVVDGDGDVVVVSVEHPTGQFISAQSLSLYETGTGGQVDEDDTIAFLLPDIDWTQVHDYVHEEEDVD